MILLRHELGEVLRERRQDQSRTLRDVAASGRTTDGDHRRPGSTAAGAHDPAWGASAADGRATVQDIPVHDGETTDEGDEL